VHQIEPLTAGSIIALALLVDFILGEPSRWHPLVGFGRCANWLEETLNRGTGHRVVGVVAWSLMVVLPVIITGSVLDIMALPLNLLFQVLILYIAIGNRSLVQHARDVTVSLVRGDIEQARMNVNRLVSRDVSHMSESQVAGAAVESVLENGNDAVVAPLFWYVVAGAPGVVLYRLANTLDAMWGYRSARYRYFGWWAARSDDLLNLLPAQLTAICYSICSGRYFNFWRQGFSWKSFNAGSVMAAGSAGLRITTGGEASYRGESEQRPLLGCGRRAQAADIDRACRLLQHSVFTAAIALVLCYSLLAR
jgi:adenosylcobinamide-phosphate synthase